MVREIRPAICVLSALLLVATAATADTIVLVDGTVVTGTVLGSESIHPGDAHPVAISVVEASGNVRTLAAEIVDYLVVSGANGPRLISFASQSETGKSHKSKALLIVSCGVVMTIIATVAPFGEQEEDAGYGEVDHIPTYNALNGVLGIAGLATVLVGGIMSVTEDSEESSCTPALEPGLSPISYDPGVAVCFRF